MTWILASSSTCPTFLCLPLSTPKQQNTTPKAAHRASHMTWILAPSERRSKKMSLAPLAALRTTRPATLTTCKGDRTRGPERQQQAQAREVAGYGRCGLVPAARNCVAAGYAWQLHGCVDAHRQAMPQIPTDRQRLTPQGPAVFEF